MRFLVCGTRAPKYAGTDPIKRKRYYQRVHQELFYILEAYIVQNFTVTPIEVIEGGATGADKAGSMYSTYYGIKPKRFEADWDLYGKQAGFMRNREMADYLDKNDHVISLWDMKSSGTDNMMALAKNKKIKVHEVNCSEAYTLFKKWAQE